MVSSTSERSAVTSALQVIFKRKKLITLVFLVVALGISFAVVRQPAMYEATGKLLVKRARHELVLTAGDVRNTNVSASMPQPQDLVAEVELIKNRTLIEGVVKTLGMDRESRTASVDPSVMVAGVGQGGVMGWIPAWIPTSLVTWIPWRGTVTAEGERPDRGPSSVDRAVGKVMKGLTVRGIPNSNLIEVRYQTTDAGNAAEVVNALLSQYLDRYLEFRRTPGVTGFFATQRDLLESRLKRAEAALGEFQQQAGIIAAGTQAEAYSRQLADAEERLIDARYDAREYEIKLEINKSLLASEPERVVRNVTTRANPFLDNLNARLVELQLERTKLLQKYTPTSRFVADLDNQIAQLRQEITAQPAWVVASQMDEVNPLRRDLQEKVYATQHTLARAATKQANLQETIEQARRRLEDLGSAAVARDRLIREVKANEEAYLLYRKKVEEARISEAMDEHKMMNISIAETAYPTPVPVGPRKDLSLMFAVMVGLVSGVGGAFLREFFDDSISSEATIKSAVGLPVLASIPEEKNGKNGRNGDKHRDA
jgi:uncharacterized protein involved in exopolysaccharide biosynthesis